MAALVRKLPETPLTLAAGRAPWRSGHVRCDETPRMLDLGGLLLSRCALVFRCGCPPLRPIRLHPLTESTACPGTHAPPSPRRNLSYRTNRSTLAAVQTGEHGANSGQLVFGPPFVGFEFADGLPKRCHHVNGLMLTHRGQAISTNAKRRDRQVSSPTIGSDSTVQAAAHMTRNEVDHQTSRSREPTKRLAPSFVFSFRLSSRPATGAYSSPNTGVRLEPGVSAASAGPVAEALAAAAGA